MKSSKDNFWKKIIYILSIAISGAVAFLILCIPIIGIFILLINLVFFPGRVIFISKIEPFIFCDNLIFAKTKTTYESFVFDTF